MRRGISRAAAADSRPVLTAGIYKTFTRRRHSVDAMRGPLRHAAPMTKLLLPSFLAVCGAVSSLAAQQAAPGTPAAPVAAVRAKPTAKPAPATPPGDPFVRGTDTAKAAPAPAAPAPVSLPKNLLVTVETWSLSEADFIALLDGPANGRAPYDRLEELAKAGQAKLTGLIAVNTKSGQRAVAESVDEVRFSTGFSLAQRAGEIAFPTEYEVRHVGDTFEVQPVLGQDEKTIDLNLVPHAVRFEGYRDWQPEAAAAPIGQPHFRSEKVTCARSVLSGWRGARRRCA